MALSPIVLIEDDIDDQEMLQEVIEDLEIKNPLFLASTPGDALNFLLSTEEKPLLILCDVNLPRQSGIDFKNQLDADPHLRKKSIPFIFYTTSADQTSVNNAFSQLSVQGYFQKQLTYGEVKETIRVIFQYWSLCKHPTE